MPKNIFLQFAIFILFAQVSFAQEGYYIDPDILATAVQNSTQNISPTQAIPSLTQSLQPVKQKAVGILDQPFEMFGLILSLRNVLTVAFLGLAIFFGVTLIMTNIQPIAIIMLLFIALAIIVNI